MSPKTKKQFEQIRADRKTAIMDAALQVFAEEGYHNASVSKVSQRAGVSKGLMYNYFENKEELLHQLLGTLVTQEAKIMEEINLDTFNETDFEQYINHIFEVLKANPKRWKLYFSLSAQPEVFRVISEKYKDIQAQFTAAILQFFKKQGHANPETLLHYFFATLGGMKMYYIMSGEVCPIQDLKRMLIEQFVKPDYAGN